MTACPIAPICPTPNAQGDAVTTHLFLLFIILVELARSCIAFGRHSPHNEEFILLLIFSPTLLFAFQSQVLPHSIRHCSGFDVRRPHGNNSLPCRKRVPTV